LTDNIELPVCDALPRRLLTDHFPFRLHHRSPRQMGKWSCDTVIPLLYGRGELRFSWPQWLLRLTSQDPLPFVMAAWIFLA